MGCCYDNLGDLIAAKHAYLNVLELRPEYIDAYKSLAITYIKSEEFDKAVEIGKKLWKFQVTTMQFITFWALLVWQERCLSKV